MEIICSMDDKDKSRLYEISKLDKSFTNYEEIMILHKNAIDKDELTYTDPETGYEVFTAATLLDKGFCCGSGCRHCPY